MSKQIIVHPWYMDGECQIYSDFGDPIEGWCVYLRTPGTPPDIIELGDFDTRDEAWKAARHAARVHKVSPDEIYIEE